MRYAARNIFIGQLVLYTGLAVCIVLKPSGLGANSGISYFGIFRKTFFPYACALIGAAFFMVRAMLNLPLHETILRFALNIYALLIVGIVISPYTATQWLNNIHIACGAALFSLQLVMSGLLAWRQHTWWSILLTLAELVAGIFAAIYFPEKHGFLIQSQMVFQLAFGILLILTLRSLAESAPTQHNAALRQRIQKP